MEIGNELINNIEEAKITAVKKVIVNLGIKYDFELNKIANDTYKFISKQGKEKIFVVFGTYKQYSKWYEENKNKQKKMFKSWTQYVVQLV